MAEDAYARLAASSWPTIWGTAVPIGSRITAVAALVIVNRDPTPYDMAATAVIRDPIGTAVPRIVGQLLAASRA